MALACLRAMQIKLYLCLLLLSGCVSAPHRDHTPSEQAWLIGVIAGQIADYETTKDVLEDGGVEKNPLLSDRPNDDSLLLFKAVHVGLCYWLGQRQPESRKNIYKWCTGFGFGAALYNSTQ